MTAPLNEQQVGFVLWLPLLFIFKENFHILSPQRKIKNQFIAQIKHKQLKCKGFAVCLLCQPEVILSPYHCFHFFFSNLTGCKWIQSTENNMKQTQSLFLPVHSVMLLYEGITEYLLLWLPLGHTWPFQSTFPDLRLQMSEGMFLAESKSRPAHTLWHL